jgi:glycosyltransferase involved in cell wall biosynthesis
MKILHLATHDNFGGAARAAYRQHLALRRHGIDSRMLVRHKHSNDADVTVYSGDPSFFCRAARVLRRTWIDYQEKRSRKSSREIVCGLTDPRADLLRDVGAEISEADVINIHKVQHFVDLPALLRLLPSSKPVVITLHDLSPITGGCDYPGSCRRFEATCGCCPIMDSHRGGDYSHRIFHMKEMAYSRPLRERLAFVANSFWSGEKARLSALTKGRKVEVIHYGLAQTVYSPQKRRESRQTLGIGAEEAVLLFAAHDLGLPHKGGRYLRDALVNVRCQRPIRLLTMGGGHLQVDSGYRHTHFGQIESDELQTLLYRAADVFVIPSLEEAFGQSALEAVACGAVVAGFNVGGIPDIVKCGLNGLLVERQNTRALSEAIQKLLEDEALRHRWQNSCENWVREHFSYSKNAAAYVALYNSLLKVELRNQDLKLPDLQTSL